MNSVRRVRSLSNVGLRDHVESGVRLPVMYASHAPDRSSPAGGAASPRRYLWAIKSDGGKRIGLGPVRSCPPDQAGQMSGGKRGGPDPARTKPSRSWALARAHEIPVEATRAMINAIIPRRE